jgi:hypothetical protein
MWGPSETNTSAEKAVAGLPHSIYAAALYLLGLAAEECGNVEIVSRDILGDVADILLYLMNNGLLFAGG